MANIKEVFLSFAGVFVILLTVMIVITGVYLIWIHSQISETQKEMEKIERYQRNKAKKEKKKDRPDEDVEAMLNMIDSRLVIKNDKIRRDWVRNLNLEDN